MPQFALSPVGSPTGVHSPQQHQQQHSPLAAVQFGGRGGSAAAATREQYTSFVLGDAPKQARCSSLVTVSLSAAAATKVLELFRRLDTSGSGSLDAHDFEVQEAALCAADQQRIAASHAMRRQLATELGLEPALRSGAGTVDFESFIAAFKRKVLDEMVELPAAATLSFGQYFEQLGVAVNTRVETLVAQMASVL